MSDSKASEALTSNLEVIGKLNVWIRHFGSGTGIRNESTRMRILEDLRVAVVALSAESPAVETTAYRFPRAAAGSDWTIDTNFLLAVHQKVGIPEHFDHCDMEHIEEVLLALEKVSPRAPRSADPDAQPAGRAESTAEGSTQKASAPADGRRPDEAL